MPPDERFKAYIKPGKPCECGKPSANASVWLFPIPIVKLARDGMPAGKWVWQCNFVRESADVVTIAAAKERPPVGSVRPLLNLAREQGFKLLRWERVDEAGETRVFTYELT